MPQVFRIGSYVVFFWSNESAPLEPVHVHVAQGTPTQNATKIWITSTGKCLLCSNSSKIPDRLLHNIMRIVEARSEEVVKKWQDHFGEVKFYC